MKFCFNIFDTNGDGLISIKDIIDYTNNIHFTDRFLKNDALKIIKFIKSKYNSEEDSSITFPNIYSKRENYLTARALHKSCDKLVDKRNRLSSMHAHFSLPNAKRSVDPTVRESNKKIVLKLSNSSHNKPRQKSLVNIFDAKRPK